MPHIKAKYGRVLIGRFEFGDDLLNSLNDVCKMEKITLGFISVIGAVTRAELGYYDQAQKRYTNCIVLEKKLEIASCTGNISFKDKEIFVHAHISLADHDGTAYGGHLMPGS